MSVVYIYVCRVVRHPYIHIYRTLYVAVGSSAPAPTKKELRHKEEINKTFIHVCLNWSQAYLNTLPLQKYKTQSENEDPS